MSIDASALRRYGDEVEQQIREAADYIEDLEEQVAELQKRCGDYEDNIYSLEQELKAVTG